LKAVNELKLREEIQNVQPSSPSYQTSHLASVSERPMLRQNTQTPSQSLARSSAHHQSSNAAANALQ